MNFLKYLSIIICFFLFIGIVSINVLSFKFRSPETSIKEYFEPINVAFNVKTISTNGHSIRYVETGNMNPSAPIILFIHGAPGSLEDFKAYLADYDLRRKFRLISVDRLGYGYSDYGNSQVDIKRQSEAIRQVLVQYSPSHTYLVAHSYGCPIAGKLAIDYPSQIDGLIMCAPLNDPYSEPIKWYSQIANLKLVRWVMPSYINVASDEKMNHAQSLKDIESDWANIKCQVLHIHGKDDALAPFNENIAFSKKVIPKDNLTLKALDNVGHLLIWNKPALIKKLTLEFIISNISQNNTHK